MRISELEGRRVALWGFGREGRATWAALRGRFPQMPLTVFCPAGECVEVTAVVDELTHVDGRVSADALAGFDLVIKSPGISPYTPMAQQALALGAVFGSGTALWFGERLPGLTLCVTGTKGKSTTSALIAHLLRCGGHRVALAGNVGMPLLELLAPAQAPDVWVIELSSYQTGDAQAPDLAMVLNLFPEHLDWHGSEARYIHDKLALVDRAAPRRVLLNAGDPRLLAHGQAIEGVHWFNGQGAWHLRGSQVYRDDEPVIDAAVMSLPGRHNQVNLCAALAAIDALGIDPRPLAMHAASFAGLVHRLQPLGQRNGIAFVDDSISTTPHASIAALECFGQQAVAVLVGGFDRGLDWTVFAEHVRANPPAAIVTMGQNGPRIFALLQASALPKSCVVLGAADLQQAVLAAVGLLPPGGLVLLSPGAPSFPTWRNYAERGRAFAVAAGLADTAGQSGVAGLGIA
jgi:UDP-N-acetylmuramoyl-L-alanine---L-glutamate ligase